MANVSFHDYHFKGHGNSQFWVDFDHSECQNMSALAGPAAAAAASTMSTPAGGAVVSIAVNGALQRIREQDKGDGSRVVITMWTGGGWPPHLPGTDIDVQSGHADVDGGMSLGPVGFSF